MLADQIANPKTNRIADCNCKPQFLLKSSTLILDLTVKYLL